MTKYFAAIPYKGTGGTLAIDGCGFQPDLVIIKRVDASSSWYAFDSVRGATNYVVLESSTIETTNATSLTSFDSDGFTLGDATITNTYQARYIAYCFKKVAGFLDIVTYTGLGIAQAINHNLGAAPASMIVRRRDTAAGGRVYHKAANGGTTPANYVFNLSSTSAESLTSTPWNNTAPTSTQFTVGTQTTVNALAGTYVAYLFGDSSTSSNLIEMGGFTTNGSGAATISLPFTPQAVIVKARGTTGSWIFLDKFRAWGSGNDSSLIIEGTGAATTSTDYGAPATDEFSVTGLSVSQTYIYFAFISNNEVTDWLLPGTGASETISGGNSTDWTSTSNITADDTAEAAWDVSSGTNALGPYLKATNFDMSSVPSGSTPLGMEMAIRRREVSSTDNISTERLRPIKAGTVQSTNFNGFMSGVEWPNASAESGAVEIIEGGGTDLGGATISESDMRDSGFGYAMSISHASGTTPSCRVEYMKLRMFYRPPTAATGVWTPKIIMM